MFYYIPKTFIINTNFYYIVINTSFDISQLFDNQHNAIHQNLFDTSTTDIYHYINKVLKPNKCQQCLHNNFLKAINKSSK